MTPFRWVGSKRRIAPRIAALMPTKYGVYHEPFCGSAALFFYVLPARAMLSDLNPDLVNCLQVMRHGSGFALADEANNLLRMIRTPHDYRAIRSIVGGAPLFRAARFLALQATSFQGLWRTNLQGLHNVPPRDKLWRVQPYGAFDLSGASSWLQCASIHHRDALTAMTYPERGDFVYLDPPYVDTFAKYAEEWTPLHLAEMIDCAFSLKRRGVHVVASDNDTPLTRALYKKARKIHSFKHAQSMAASFKARIERRELLVCL